MASRGYIKLYRELQGHWIWENDKPFDKRSAWIDLLLMANHSGKKFLLGQELVEVERGQTITSELKLMERWGWSKSKVRKFLQLLEKDNMIIKKSDTKKTALTICNYTKWQDSETTKEPQKNHEETAKEPRKDTNKNDKECIKNDLELEIGEKRKRFIPPTNEEVKSYCVDRKNSVDPERFVDFYESKGWMVGKNKMKDWKAAVRSWEKKETPKQAEAPTAKKTTFHLNESRGKDYTNEELEKILLKG